MTRVTYLPNVNARETFIEITPVQMVRIIAETAPADDAYSTESNADVITWPGLPAEYMMVMKRSGDIFYVNMLA